MAKMFYKLAEAQQALGISEEEVRQLAREGRLREFRDGSELMFKVDQVEQLKAELGAGGDQGVDQIDLEPAEDSGAPIGLADESRSGASGASYSLSDSAEESGVALQDDTSAPSDELGLSGSLDAIPSPAGVDQGEESGINVFAADEVADEDPSAQTAISPGAADINLEGAGSGSGLLDLTRESDDTSLGAVMDEIGPTEQPVSEGAVDRGSIPVPTGGVSRGRVASPVAVEVVDDTAPAFGAASLAGFVALLFGAFALMAATVGTWPEPVQALANQNLWIIFGAGVVAAVVFFVVGLLIGKMGQR